MKYHKNAYYAAHRKMCHPCLQIETKYLEEHNIFTETKYLLDGIVTQEEDGIVMQGSQLSLSLPTWQRGSLSKKYDY